MPFKVNELPEAPYSFKLVENKTGSWRNFKPVIDYDKCIRCMICWKFCPDVAIKAVHDETHKLKVKPVIDYEYCKGCGVCFNECPVDAINMVPEE